jgi:hypothetical protein
VTLTEELLEQVRQALPEPFGLEARRSELFQTAAARQLLGNGQASADRLLRYLERRPEPSLARVAVMLLSGLPAGLFYSKLLDILARQDRDLVAAYEPGIWWVRLPAGRIARDLASLAGTAANPGILLLLQRPEAAAVHDALTDMVRSHRRPTSLNALYALDYALSPDDMPVLREVSRWSDDPAAAAFAGLRLLRLGSAEGLAGIRAGLESADQLLREATYRDLAPYLSTETVRGGRLAPARPPDTQGQVITGLLDEAARGMTRRHQHEGDADPDL